MNSEPIKITVLYTDAGGGHYAAAKALEAVLADEPNCRVSLLNVYRDLIPDFDLFRHIGYKGEDIYNQLIQGKGWTGAFCLSFYAAVQISTRLQWKKGVRRFREYWQQEQPDLVISVMPFLNTILAESLQPTSIPLMVVMTDFREPQRFSWLDRRKYGLFICPTAAAHQDTLKLGHPIEQTHLSEGVLLHPSFYQSGQLDRSAERLKLGLSSSRLTLCMLYGGSGSNRMMALAAKLASLKLDVQVIFLCGRHQKALSELDKMKLPFPHITVGYTDKVAFYMQISDLFIGKPGPATLSEAVESGLPLLLDRKNLLLQERYNTRWVKEQQIGLSFRTLAQFERSLEVLSQPEQLSAMKERLSRMHNRTIFQIPALVRRYLKQDS